MNKIRYISYSLLLIFAFMIIGELHTWHLEVFTEEYASTTLYKQKEIESAEMGRDIMNSSEKHGVGIFVYRNVYDSAFSYTTYVYGTEGTSIVLKERSDVTEGKHDSIFLGSHKIVFKEFSDIKDFSLFDTYYLFGDKEKYEAFKIELINKYAGNFPQDPHRVLNGSKQIIMIWLIIYLFFLLLTSYNIALIKKETIVNLILGDSLKNIIGNNILRDIIFILISYFIIVKLLSAQANVMFHFKFSIIALISFLIINSLLYFS